MRITSVHFSLALLLLAANTTIHADTSPSAATRIVTSKDGKYIEVTGLSKGAQERLKALKPDSEKWTEVFALRVDTGTEVPAMLGSYRIEKDVLRFSPRFPLSRGVVYVAKLNADGKVTLSKILLPKQETKPTTIISAVYPTTNRLPENQLKFYIHFSAPMELGDSYRHIQLLNAKGKVVEDVFLELEQELWDPEGKRFTLYFHPGRVKRGLKPREDMGPSLEEGKSYTLVIASTWLDAKGNPLKQPFRKSFTVGAPDDVQPAPTKWKIQAPKVGTKEPVRVALNKSMDHALLQSMLWIAGSDGKRIPGTITTTDRETVWLFTPSQPWKAGAYDVVADTRAEDLAGNSIARPFEVDILRPVEKEIKTATVKRRFEVK